MARGGRAFSTWSMISSLRSGDPRRSSLDWLPHRGGSDAAHRNLPLLRGGGVGGSRALRPQERYWGDSLDDLREGRRCMSR